MSEHCSAVCCLFWVSRISLLFFVSLCQMSLCWLTLMLTVTYKPLILSAFMPNVVIQRVIMHSANFYSYGFLSFYVLTCLFASLSHIWCAFVCVSLSLFLHISLILCVSFYFVLLCVFLCHICSVFQMLYVCLNLFASLHLTWIYYLFFLSFFLSFLPLLISLCILLSISPTVFLSISLFLSFLSHYFSGALLFNSAISL